MTVYYFTSPHCAPCKQFLPLVEAAQKRGADVQIKDIATPAGACTASTFGVTTVPSVATKGQPGSHPVRSAKFLRTVLHQAEG